jgi:exopolyphosphatase/guanosine-5'-triphosphate,3'-diphosphate pyrophosphatase
MSEEPARVGVLEVGCSSAHLVVVDGGAGSLLGPVLSRTVLLGLDETIGTSGNVSGSGMDRIAAVVEEAREATRRLQVSTFVPYVTSMIRDAANVDEVADHVTTRAGVDLRVFTRRQEAELGYLAARDWFGWSAGTLAVLDVGGGAIELAIGDAAVPLCVLSLPPVTRLQGSGRGSRSKQLRRSVAELADVIATTVHDDKPFGGGIHAVTCAKAFRPCARFAVARSHRDRPFAPRRLSAADLAEWTARIASELGKSRAVPRHHAHDALMGAIAVQALVKATGHGVVDVCPWSTREGLLLTLLRLHRYDATCGLAVRPGGGLATGSAGA